MTTVVLVDDQAMIRAGLRSVLESADIEIVGEAADGGAALPLLRATAPQVVLMDLRMPGVDGVEATRRIRADAALGAVRILILTTFDGDAEVVAALSAGADGFLSKSAEPEDLIDAVLRTAAGESSLSPRASRAVVSHLAKGAASVDPDPELAARVATLTPRERDLVIAAAAGDDNATIAKRLFISPLTVKTHLNRAMMKLDARDRGQLVAIAYRSGLVG
ncbi:response regulator [Microbacterium sp. NPDC056044]|uniref:response regulator n=1 Tax=Microbacterium sp. NPDC056044 TaxID=3345690 RepID=UPI0035E09E02